MYIVYKILLPLIEQNSKQSLFHLGIRFPILIAVILKKSGAWEKVDIGGAEELGWGSYSVVCRLRTFGIPIDFIIKTIEHKT